MFFFFFCFRGRLHTRDIYLRNRALSHLLGYVLLPEYNFVERDDALCWRRRLRRRRSVCGGEKIFFLNKKTPRVVARVDLYDFPIDIFILFFFLYPLACIHDETVAPRVCDVQRCSPVFGISVLGE